MTDCLARLMFFEILENVPNFDPLSLRVRVLPSKLSKACILETLIDSDYIDLYGIERSQADFLPMESMISSSPSGSVRFKM